jgi:hypothetical protein
MLFLVTARMAEFKLGDQMKKFAAVLLAVCMSAGVASAAPMMHKPMMHHHMHMWPMCKEGMNKMACVCKGATAKAMCKGGQWCHTWAATCTM